mmetsp:Transcript_18540/g.26094  ORF Transcript_18540/g.26094 Transcript_18540/m.26094 type:complete len:127 (+) Transcript_18540:93-473(+)
MGSDSEAKDAVSEAIEKAKPVLSKLTFGSIVGYCSGAATKKVGKAIAVLGGLAFIAIQSAVYSGYVEVNWNKVQKEAIAKVDTDGDGELTVKDVKTYWFKVKNILTNKIPSAGGFSIGFLYGLSHA